MFTGILLLLLGILMLLDRLGIITAGFGDYLLPVVIIALGVDFLLGRSRRRAD